MYGMAYKKHIAVILCAFLMFLSVSTVCAVESPESSGIYYIMPVYTNVYRFAQYNKQSLENDSESDVQWIKESADVYRQPLEEHIFPVSAVATDVAIYATAMQRTIQSSGYSKGRIYHMLN